MITYIKNLFKREKRERGVSRIQEGMLLKALTSPQEFYIPFLHSPWLNLFGLVDKPLNRLVEDGYLVEDRPVSKWYSLTPKGLNYIWQMIGNLQGNARVTFPSESDVNWTKLYKLLRESDFAISIEDAEHAVKVGP